MPIVDTKYRGTKEYLLVYRELITAAEYRGTTSYPALAAILRLPTKGNYMQQQVGHILGEISEDEHLQGRPMLSAIVVSVTNHLPGKGFFGLAQTLGKLEGESDEERLRFWRAELDAVYREWHRVPYPEPE